MTRTAKVGALAAVMLLLPGCGATVPGTATWPGEVLQRALLGSADFPPGVQYDRVTEQAGTPDGGDGPGSMLSRPKGCANALTNVIRQSAERGPGSAAKYDVGYDGARIRMTVLSWNLDLEKLKAEAQRCERFEAFFDPDSDGIPIITEPLAGLGGGALGYQQTMDLKGTRSSVYMGFQNIGRRAVFGVAFPVPNADIEAKAFLPQTFLQVFVKQANKLGAS
ncbi:MAG: hypothetical protein U0R66_02475 [Mycobacterium sp.]